MSEDTMFPKVERIVEVEADFNILYGDKSDPADLHLWQLDLMNDIAIELTTYNRNGVVTWSENGKYAFKEIEKGLAYFDEKWTLFPKEVQEAWSSHVADKEILDE